MTPQLWLQSERNYDIGRQLYEVLGTNPMLKRTLSSGPNRYNREALAYELGKLAKAGVGTAVVLSAPAPPVTPAATFAVASGLVEPAVPALDDTARQLLAELAAQRPLFYDERRYLHAQLEGLATDAERFTAAQRIQQLSRQLNENWQHDAYVRAHGHLPVAEPVAPAFDVKNGTLAELIDYRGNLRCNISKWKKKPARANDLARAQAEVALLTARIDELKGKEAGRG